MRHRLGLKDLLLLALLSALSIAIKPYIRAPFGFIQSTLGVPVGVFLGGLYMFWPVFAGRLVPAPGAMFLTCLLQGLVATLTGFTGLLGPAAFLSYLAPGVVLEVLRLAFGFASRKAPGGPAECVLGGLLGNMAGAATNTALFFNVGPRLLMVIGVSSLSGALGGLLAFALSSRAAARGFTGERRVPS